MSNEQMVRGITEIVLERNYTKGFVVARPQRGGGKIRCAFSWHWSLAGAVRQASQKVGSAIYDLRTGEVSEPVMTMRRVGRIVPSMRFERF